MKPPDMRLGQHVTVNERSDFHADFKDEVWRVVSLSIEPSGLINVTIAQDGFNRWDNPTDGFRPEELTLVTQ